MAASCALPMRAAIVAQPSEFPWSSRASNAFGREDPILRPHPAYQSLGASATERQLAYRALFDNVLGDDDISEIQAYIQQQRASATTAFAQWSNTNSAAALSTTASSTTRSAEVHG